MRARTRRELQRTARAGDDVPAIALSPERIAAIFGVDAVMVDTGEGRVPIARHPL